MKTKVLIQLLQEADPSGEDECCINNTDIFTVEKEPAYWDGRLEVLIRDENKKPFYDIVGAKRTSKGSKISITPYSIKSYISDDPESAVIDYSECGNNDFVKKYRASDEKIRRESLDFNLKMEQESFYDWIKKNIKHDISNDIDYMIYCYKFYVENRDLLNKLPQLPSKKDAQGNSWGASIEERRKYHWDNIVIITPEKELKINE